MVQQAALILLAPESYGVVQKQVQVAAAQVVGLCHTWGNLNLEILHQECEQTCPTFAPR